MQMQTALIQVSVLLIVAVPVSVLPYGENPRVSTEHQRRADCAPLIKNYFTAIDSGDVISGKAAFWDCYYYFNGNNPGKMQRLSQHVSEPYHQDGNPRAERMGL
jgi:hypothetical protein